MIRVQIEALELAILVDRSEIRIKVPKISRHIAKTAIIDMTIPEFLCIN
jgi:hypothetical protein